MPVYGGNLLHFVQNVVNLGVILIIYAFVNVQWFLFIRTRDSNRFKKDYNAKNYCYYLKISNYCVKV